MSATTPNRKSKAPARAPRRRARAERARSSPRAPGRARAPTESAVTQHTDVSRAARRHDECIVDAHPRLAARQFAIPKGDAASGPPLWRCRRTRGMADSNAAVFPKITLTPITWASCGSPDAREPAHADPERDEAERDAAAPSGGGARRQAGARPPPPPPRPGRRAPPAGRAAGEAAEPVRGLPRARRPRRPGEGRSHERGAGAARAAAAPVRPWPKKPGLLPVGDRPASRRLALTRRGRVSRRRRRPRPAAREPTASSATARRTTRGEAELAREAKVVAARYAAEAAKEAARAERAALGGDFGKLFAGELMADLKAREAARRHAAAIQDMGAALLAASARAQGEASRREAAELERERRAAAGARSRADPFGGGAARARAAARTPAEKMVAAAWYVQNRWRATRERRRAGAARASARVIEERSARKVRSAQARCGAAPGMKPRPPLPLSGAAAAQGAPRGGARGRLLPAPRPAPRRGGRDPRAVPHARARGAARGVAAARAGRAERRERMAAGAATCRPSSAARARAGGSRSATPRRRRSRSTRGARACARGTSRRS